MTTSHEKPAVMSDKSQTTTAGYDEHGPTKTFRLIFALPAVVSCVAWVCAFSFARQLQGSREAGERETLLLPTRAR